MALPNQRFARPAILAALRRWLSYPAARGADAVATNGGKHKPLENGEIDQLCKRITELDTNRDAMHTLGQTNNGARERKGPKLRAGVRAAQIGDHVRSGDIKSQRHVR